MSNYEVVSKQLHQNKFVKTKTNFKFAAQDPICSLALQEAPQAALHLPIAFSKIGEDFGLFVVQGLEQGSNFLVDAAGNWLAGYVPAAYQAYPFLLVDTEDQKQVLCVNSDSGLVNDAEGYPFFDEMGEPSSEIKELLSYLSKISASHKSTHTLCAMLESFELLEQWPITVKKGNEEVNIEGLYRVNEAKFNSLGADSLAALHEKSALALIFCQLLSMQNLARIAHQVKFAGETSDLPKELTFDFAEDSGNISFD